MATLVLVRHAQAAVGGADVDRVLTPGGVRDATALGVRLGGLGLVPDAVFVSPARRAQQTWEHACAGLHQAGVSMGPPVIDERIYENTAQSLLAVAQDVPAEHEIVALIGHNPSIERLARLLADAAADPAAAAGLLDGVATSGVAVFSVVGPIAAVTPIAATLTAFFVVRG